MNCKVRWETAIWKYKVQLKKTYLMDRLSGRQTKGIKWVEVLDVFDQRDNLGSVCKKVWFPEGGADYSESGSNWIMAYSLHFVADVFLFLAALALRESQWLHRWQRYKPLQVTDKCLSQFGKD